MKTIKGMHVLWICVFFSVAVSLVNTQTTGLPPATKNKLINGFELGSEMARVLAERKFKESLTAIATNLQPYLGALVPFVGLILAFIPTDLAVLNQIKELASQIDNRFDIVDLEFNEVKRLIREAVLNITFFQVERDLNLMKFQYERLRNVSPEGAENQKQIFITAYEARFIGRGTDLFNAVNNSRNVFGVNLVKTAMDVTKNNRRQLRHFLLSIMELLLRASTIDITYLKLKGFDVNAEEMADIWVNRIGRVKVVYESADNEVTNNYYKQSAEEINDFAIRNNDLTNQQFVGPLADLLGRKFDWLAWLVVVYNPIAGFSQHTISGCNAHVRFRQNGRNIVVASKDKRSAAIDLAAAERVMRTVEVQHITSSTSFWTGITTYRRTGIRHAQDIWEDIKSRFSSDCSTGVIRSGSGLYFAAASRRLKRVSRSPYFDLHMWG